MRRIYVDNAATTWPKPEAVYTAVDSYTRLCGAPAGRGAYSHAVEAARIVDRTRQSVARLLDVDEPRRVIFALNGTDALNIAIHGSLQPGDHVVTTVAEHNSVLRPLRFLEETNDIDVARVACDGAGLVDAEGVAAALKPNTKLVVVTHASNVTGAVQPVEKIGQRVREHGALLLVDAAQSLGHLSCTLDDLCADLIAAPGHKGLLGPLGTGVLIVGPRAEPHLRSYRQGGTGTESQDDRQPDSLPDRLEAGNLNVPGIAGLGAGIEYLFDRGAEAVRSHEMALTERLLDGLGNIKAVKVHGPLGMDRRMGVVSLSIADEPPQDVAAALDSGFGIQVRAGLHCAPLIHDRLGTLEMGGTVRFSFGPFNTMADIDSILSAVKEVASAAVGA